MPEMFDPSLGPSANRVSFVTVHPDPECDVLNW